MSRVRILREAPPPRLRDVLADYAQLGEESPWRAEAREALDHDPSCRRWYEQVQLQRRLTKQSIESRRAHPHKRIPDDLRSIDAWLDRHLGRLDREAVARALSDYAVELLNFDPHFSASVKPDGGARPLLGACEARRRLIDSLHGSRAPACDLDPDLLREDYETLRDRDARFARVRALLRRCHEVQGQEYLPATGNEALVDWFEDRLDRAWAGFERLARTATSSRLLGVACGSLAVLSFDRGESSHALDWIDSALVAHPLHAVAAVNSLVWREACGDASGAARARKYVQQGAIRRLVSASVSRVDALGQAEHAFMLQGRRLNRMQWVVLSSQLFGDPLPGEVEP